MIKHRFVRKKVSELVNGYRGLRVSYEHVRDEHRTVEQREKFEKLKDDIKTKGIVNPLIIFKNHVLIGMRRKEIAESLGIEEIDCIEVLEDIYSHPNPNAVYEIRKTYQKQEGFEVWV